MTMQAPPTSPPPAEEQLVCPLCDYDLRGLIDPRCPECGYTFEWADLRDPARRRHRYLFEHHPQRNVRSFLRTMIGGLRPSKFWSGLLPSQPSEPRRLRAYALVITISALLPTVALTLHMLGRAWGLQTLGSRLFTRILLTHAVMLLWPALTLAALMIFQWSLRRARLRPIHFARCVVYCADLILWGNLLLFALIAAYVLRQILTGPVPRGDPYHQYEVAASLAAWLVLGGFIYRLAIALRKYLRFDHAIATVLATQVIVALAVLIVVTWSLVD